MPIQGELRTYRSNSSFMNKLRYSLQYGITGPLPRQIVNTLLTFGHKSYGASPIVVRLALPRNQEWLCR
jgi:hypothetical protein